MSIDKRISLHMTIIYFALLFLVAIAISFVDSLWIRNGIILCSAFVLSSMKELAIIVLQEWFRRGSRKPI